MAFLAIKQSATDGMQLVPVERLQLGSEHALQSR